jgi:hypothetical protein
MVTITSPTKVIAVLQHNITLNGAIVAKAAVNIARMGMTETPTLKINYSEFN